MDSFLEEDEVEGVAGVKGVFGVRGEEGISGELVPFDETRSASILLLSLASFDSSIEPSTLFVSSSLLSESAPGRAGRMLDVLRWYEAVAESA